MSRLLLRNEIRLGVLMNQHNAVLDSDAGIAVHAHARLKYIATRAHILLLATIEGMAPYPCNIYRVVVAAYPFSLWEKFGMRE